MNTRIDLPLIYNDVPSADNPFGEHEFGLSDLLLQALLIKPLTQSALVFGTQIVFYQG